MFARVVLSLFLSLLTTAVAVAGWTSVSGSKPAWLVAGAGSQLFGADAGAFYVSSDNGATWQTGAGPADSPYTALAYLNGGVWIGTEKRGAAFGGASGAAWVVKNSGMIETLFGNTDAIPIKAFAADAGTGNIVAANNAGTYLSKDGGATWTKVVTGLPNCTVQGFPIVCTVHDVVAVSGALIATTEAGIYRSTDGGVSWAAAGLAGSKVGKLSAGSGAVYALASGLYKSTDNGATWAAVSGLAASPTAVLAHPSKAGTVYAGTGAGEVYQSTDGGAVWTKISDGTISGGVSALVVSAEPAGKLLAAAAGGIYRFDGESFELAIPPVLDAALNKAITSEAIMIAGLLKAEPISIVGGEYALDGGAFTSAPGTVANGASLRVRVQSANTYDASTRATVTVGTRKGQFVVTTRKITKVTDLTQVFTTPPPGAQIRPDGSVLVSSTTPVALKANLPAGVLIETTPGTPLTTNNGALTLTDPSGGASLTFSALGSGTVPQVAQGTFNINSTTSGNTVAVGGGSGLTTTTGQDSLTVNATGSQTLAFVQNGKVSLLFSGFASTTDVYGGETAEINNAGALKRLRIGSLNGDQKIPGDPLTLEQVATDTTVPKLDGNLARLNNTASLLTVIQEALNSQFGVTVSQISYDQSNGVVTYTAGGKTYRFIPIGAPIVQVGGTTASVRGNRFSASSAANTASGAFTLAGRGIQVTMGSALGYFTDLNQVLKASDPNASIRLRSNGVLQLNLGGASYLASPGSQSTSSGQTGAPAFVSDSSGFVAFRDSTGASQVMYPVFADIATVDTTIKALAPTSSTTASGDGTALLMLNGSPVTLLPQYPLIGLPTAHANDLWWQEGATFYIRYPDSTAQAFGIR